MLITSKEIMPALILSLVSILCITSTIYTTNIFDPICAFFGGSPYTAIVEKDYTISSTGHIYLKNNKGSITIKTGLDKKSVALKAIKHASVQEHLEHMHVLEQEVNTDNLTLRTVYDYEHIRGTIDYTLTVPQEASVYISLDEGPICIKQLSGPVNITAGQSDIYIEEPTHNVKASVLTHGNITVLYPQKTVDLSIHKGTIQVLESMESIYATVDQGSITLTCKQLPAHKEIICSCIQQGPIKVYLPENVNAAFHAKTDGGSVTSEQPITINALTTHLNETFWANIKKHIDGYINGNNAHIRLDTKKGSISLLIR